MNNPTGVFHHVFQMLNETQEQITMKLNTQANCASMLNSAGESHSKIKFADVGKIREQTLLEIYDYLTEVIRRNH